MMPILRALTAFTRPEKISHCQRIFMLAPLAALVVSAMAQAALPGAGALGNQLRQEKMLAPPPPENAPLVLPEEGHARKALSSDSRTTVVVKKSGVYRIARRSSRAE